MRITIVEGIFRRILDMLRGIEIGFADLKVNNVSALRFEFPCACERKERRFSAEAVLS